MNIDNIKNAIGNIDDDLIEAADAEPAAAPVKAFKPWLKWVAAAAAFFIVAIVPLALLSMGAFQTPNVAQRYQSEVSGGEEPGIISSSDSGEPENSSASEPNSADTVSSSGETPPKSDDRSGGGNGKNPAPNNARPQVTPEKPEHTEIPPEQPPAEPEEGEFVKDNMPAVTCRINGESKTFDYQKSTYKKKTADMDIDGNVTGFVIDYYADSRGNTLLRNGDSQELIQYGKELFFTYPDQDYHISEEEAIIIARSVIMNTDLPISKLENLLVAIRYSSDSYYVTFKTAEGNVEVILDKSGDLQFISVKKNILQRIPSERVSAAVDKMEEKLAELNGSSPDERYVLDNIHFEEWGDVVYAVFDVIHYPDKNSDESSTYQYYCVV